MRNEVLPPETGARAGHVLTAASAALIPVLFFSMATANGAAAALPDFNNIFVTVANDAGPNYDSYQNGTYSIRFEGETRGQNALHISTSPAEPYGQVTVTMNRTGTFYVTDTGGKSYEDEVILMIAVNGTVPENFRIRITSSGHTWIPNPISNRAPDKSMVQYWEKALDETFTASDLVYGPQTWKPCGGPGYPLFDGQDPADSDNTFRLMFVDLNAGVLGTNFTEFRDRGAVRVDYAIENLDTAAVFNAYSFCNLSNNGAAMIAWTNRLNGTGRSSGFSGYMVTGEVSATPVPAGGEPQAEVSLFLPLVASVAVLVMIAGRRY